MTEPKPKIVMSFGQQAAQAGLDKAAPLSSVRATNITATTASPPPSVAHLKGAFANAEPDVHQAAHTSGSRNKIFGKMKKYLPGGHRTPSDGNSPVGTPTNSYSGPMSGAANYPATSPAVPLSQPAPAPQAQQFTTIAQQPGPAMPSLQPSATPVFGKPTMTTATTTTTTISTGSPAPMAFTTSSHSDSSSASTHTAGPAGPHSAAMTSANRSGNEFHESTFNAQGGERTQDAGRQTVGYDQSSVQGARDTMGNTVNSIGQAAQDVAGSAKAQTTRAANDAKGSVQAAGDHAHSAASDVVASAQDTGNRTVESIRQPAQTAADKTGDTFNKAADTSKQYAGAAQVQAKAAIDSTTNSAKAAADTAMQTASEAAQNAKDSAIAAGTRAQELGNAAGQRVSEAAEVAGEKVQAVSDAAVAQGERAVEATKETAATGQRAVVDRVPEQLGGTPHDAPKSAEARQTQERLEGAVEGAQGYLQQAKEVVVHAYEATKETIVALPATVQQVVEEKILPTAQQAAEVTAGTAAIALEKAKETAAVAGETLAPVAKEYGTVALERTKEFTAASGQAIAEKAADIAATTQQAAAEAAEKAAKQREAWYNEYDRGLHQKPIGEQVATTRDIITGQAQPLQTGRPSPMSAIDVNRPSMAGEEERYDAEHQPQQKLSLGVPATPGVNLQAAEDLVMWRDPAISLLSLLGLTATYFLLEWSSTSLWSLVAYCLALFIGAAALWNNLVRFLQRPNAQVGQSLKTGVAQGQVYQLMNRVVEFANYMMNVIYRAAAGRDVALTLKVAGVLYLVAKLSGSFSSASFLYTATLLAFTVPKLYESNQEAVHAFAARVQNVAQEQYLRYVTPLLAKIPRSSTVNVHKRSIPQATVGASHPDFYTTFAVQNPMFSANAADIYTGSSTPRVTLGSSPYPPSLRMDVSSEKPSVHFEEGTDKDVSEQKVQVQYKDESQRGLVLPKGVAVDEARKSSVMELMMGTPSGSRQQPMTQRPVDTQGQSGPEFQSQPHAPQPPQVTEFNSKAQASQVTRSESRPQGSDSASGQQDARAAAAPQPQQEVAGELSQPELVKGRDDTGRLVYKMLPPMLDTSSVGVSIKQQRKPAGYAGHKSTGPHGSGTPMTAAEAYALLHSEE